VFYLFFDGLWPTYNTLMPNLFCHLNRLSRGLWVCLVVVAMAGCEPPSGAEANSAAKNFQELEKKKPDFEIDRLATQFSPHWNAGMLPGNHALSYDASSPSVDLEEVEDLLPRCLLKPGHWTSTVQSMKSNTNDFVGRITMSYRDADHRLLAWPHTPFTMEFSRPVALAKGRTKRVVGQLLMPDAMGKGTLNWSLERHDSFTPVLPPKFPPLEMMPPNQYFLAVLAKEPGQYAYLQVADAIRAPWEDPQGGIPQPHYRVLLFDPNRPLPLPANLLSWTSLALMIWDEMDPDQLTPDQQQALVDWLHWGGRLVISGPASLASLRGSFLEPYLSATGAETRRLTQNTLRVWNDYWVLPGNHSAGTVAPLAPWSAIILKPHAEASAVSGTDGLFYERRIGQGSLLISGVSLTSPELVNWSGFDSFLNGVLLRRPRRHFTVGPYGGICVNWKDYPIHRFDSRLTTSVRLFARDWGANESTQLPLSTLPARPKVPGRNLSEQNLSAENLMPKARDVSKKPLRPGGTGSWNEFGAVSAAARAILRDAAGVRVPAASFVVVCLVVYLVVLVPLNWMVFYTLGHVEWAWFAAPIIALLGTLVVVRQAQLDIGFVRSQTELGVLELASDYPRGHLSRYTALYTSLSTTYDVQFDDPWAVATPFPIRRDELSLTGQALDGLRLAGQRRSRLQGVAISSATTRMVHSEQIITLEGPVLWRKSSSGHWQVVNQTRFDLDDCCLIHRRAHGTMSLAGCWLGRLRSGQAATVNFRGLPISGAAGTDELLPYASERERSAQGVQPARLNIDSLMKLACKWDASADPWGEARDEYRLLARIDKPLPGCQISPSASQVRGATLVIVHLAYGDLPEPQPDANGRSDLIVE
jgi:hypothetical protein